MISAIRILKVFGEIKGCNFPKKKYNKIMKKIEIYTDGACSGNPGPGGWAAVLLYNEHYKEISGFETHTTNQRMELKAALEALKVLKQPCAVSLYSDSAYLINAFQKNWLGGWERKGWVTAGKKPVANQDLWREILALTKNHTLQWIKVKGHADNKLNNRCDQLAKEEIIKNNSK